VALRLLFKANGKTRAVPVTEEPITIGRQVGNVVTLHDDKASRFHCIIERDAGVLRVKDLGSRNGTYLNAQPIDEAGHPFRAGDKLIVGKTPFLLDGGKEVEEPKAETNGKTEKEPPSQATPATGARDLAKLAGDLPTRNVQPNDITLLNARGKLALDRGEAASGAPAESITLLRLTLLVCLRTGASDIHLEPGTEGYLLRVRVDGTMTDVARLKKSQGVKLATLVKVLADADIAKSNIIQEGSFAVKLPDRRVDARVSLTPGLYGQKLVVRVLDAANAPQYLWDLGLNESDFAILDRLVRRNEGMILVCGPTGSGKSSTLYAVLRSIDARERNVVTIEDPVEIRLDGITQQPVNEAQGNTFAGLLRSVLRQDPDVVLVGEIRDNETAVAASRAAMTGHLVFSTVHSRDAVGAVFRLLDLGVEPFQAASGLSAVVGQRLVRRLCPHCKKQRPTTEAERKLADRELPTVFDAVGCRKCLNTGYSGRRAVVEVLHFDEVVRDAVLTKQDAASLYGVLKGTGFKRLRDAALDLAASGETTFDEAERIG
jgi:general secretion pathway protein E